MALACPHSRATSLTGVAELGSLGHFRTLRFLERGFCGREVSVIRFCEADSSDSSSGTRLRHFGHDDQERQLDSVRDF